ncbi:hypothetical protein BD779DRAFT_216031 [Infundibulicybe gibba]|nr:hypothetical protein BD779DRAFT_216031 [Infundibulicybe gibba]
MKDSLVVVAKLLRLKLQQTARGLGERNNPPLSLFGGSIGRSGHFPGRRRLIFSCAGTSHIQFNLPFLPNDSLSTSSSSAPSHCANTPLVTETGSGTLIVEFSEAGTGRVSGGLVFDRNDLCVEYGDALRVYMGRVFPKTVKQEDRGNLILTRGDNRNFLADSPVEYWTVR